MANTPRFLLAYNQAARPDASYIVHARKPFGVALVTRFATSEAMEAYLLGKSGLYARQTNTFTVFEWIDSFGQQIEAEVIYRTLRQMSNWYFHTQLKPPE